MLLKNVQLIICQHLTHLRLQGLSSKLVSLIKVKKISTCLHTKRDFYLLHPTSTVLLTSFVHCLVCSFGSESGI